MKTIISKIYSLFAVLIFMSTFSCGVFFNAEIDPPKLDLEMGNQSPDSNDNYGLYEFPENVLNAQIGYGYTSVESNSTSEICLGAGYQLKVAENSNLRAAGYVGFSASHHIGKSDNLDTNITKLGVGYNYYDGITKYNEVQIVYGLKAEYEFGNLENFGNKDDVSGYLASAYLGANFNINEDMSFGVGTSIFSWGERTFKSNGNEFKQSTTAFAFNKKNATMAYLRFHF